MLGEVYMVQKKYPEAEAAFSMAVSQAPTWAQPNNNLARLYLIQGRKAEAVAKFETAVNDNPKNISAYLSLGYIFEQEKEDEKAIQIYRQALDNNPGLWVAANNLAVLLSEHADSEEQLDASLMLARQAYEQRPAEPTVQDTLGWIYYKMGDIPEAVAMLEKPSPQHREIRFSIITPVWRCIKVDRHKKPGSILKKPWKTGNPLIGGIRQWQCWRRWKVRAERESS